MLRLSNWIKSGKLIFGASLLGLSAMLATTGCSQKCCKTQTDCQKPCCGKDCKCAKCAEKQKPAAAQPTTPAPADKPPATGK